MKLQPVCASAKFEVFRICSDMESGDTRQCLRSLEPFRRAPARSLILDMSAVALMNRATIDLVVQIAHLCKRWRVHLYLACLSPSGQKVLEMICLTSLFTMTDTVQNAIDSAS